MKIGGFLKNSMIDFPGLISSVVFTSGCNFVCPYCHNPDLVGPGSGELLDPAELLSFFKKRQGLIDGVVISGGEPTLHPDLAPFCREIRDLGFQIKLDTNGTAPGVLEDLVRQNLVDYFAMDIKADPDHYSPLIARSDCRDDLLESIGIIKNSGKAHEFRTTCVAPLVSREMILKVSTLVGGANLYALQKFCDKSVLKPDFFLENTWEITDRDLVEYKSILEKVVKKCIIR